MSGGNFSAVHLAHLRRRVDEDGEAPGPIARAALAEANARALAELRRVERPDDLAASFARVRREIDLLAFGTVKP